MSRCWALAYWRASGCSNDAGILSRASLHTKSLLLCKNAMVLFPLAMLTSRMRRER